MERTTGVADKEKVVTWTKADEKTLAELTQLEETGSTLYAGLLQEYREKKEQFNKSLVVTEDDDGEEKADCYGSMKPKEKSYKTM